MTDPISIRVADLHLPHFIWLMEIGPMSHYLGGQCTGEIVLDATANSMEEAVLYARAGKYLILNDQRLTVTSGGENLNTFSQYTHNLGEL